MGNNNDRILQDSIRINESLTNSLIMGGGCLMVIVGAALSKYPRWSTIFLSIGASLIASAIVTYLNAKYALKRIAEEIVTKEWGLCAIYSSRQDMNSSCNVALQDASDQIEMIGFGFRSLRDSQDKLIRSKVKKGITVKIISMNPNSVYLTQREKDEKVAPGSIKESILQLNEWTKSLRELAPNRDNVQIRFYDSLPQDFYFRSDDHVFVGPYIYGIQSQQTISYEYTGKSKGFDHYTAYFETLWSDKEYCKDGF